MAFSTPQLFQNLMPQPTTNCFNVFLLKPMRVLQLCIIRSLKQKAVHMKYILTLLFTVTLFTAAFAQTDAEREEARRIIFGDKKGSTSYPKSGDDRNVILGGDDRTVYGGTERRYPERYPATTGSSRERRIYEINRAYDAKIYSIRQNRTLSRTEKERIIRQLETERRRELAQVNGHNYYSKDKRYTDDDDCTNGKKYKKSKGNHYGLDKGNGNPHRGK